MTIAVPWDFRIAREIAKPLAGAGVHPNAVTTFGLAVGVAAGVLFALGGQAAANWAALLFIVAVLTDHVDGEVARLSGRTSVFGHYYDHIAAGLSYTAMFIGAGIGLGWVAGGGWAVAAGLAAGFSVIAIMFIRLKISVDEGAESIRQPVLLGFEPEDTLYAIGPITWLDGFTEFDGLLTFILAAGIGAPVYLAQVVAQTRREMPEPRCAAFPQTKMGP